MDLPLTAQSCRSATIALLQRILERQDVLSTAIASHRSLGYDIAQQYPGVAKLPVVGTGRQPDRVQRQIDTSTYILLITSTFCTIYSMDMVCLRLLTCEIIGVHNQRN